MQSNYHKISAQYHFTKAVHKFSHSLPLHASLPLHVFLPSLSYILSLNSSQPISITKKEHKNISVINFIFVFKVGPAIQRATQCIQQEEGYYRHCSPRYCLIVPSEFSAQGLCPNGMCLPEHIAVGESSRCPKSWTL